MGRDKDTGKFRGSAPPPFLLLPFPVSFNNGLKSALMAAAPLHRTNARRRRQIRARAIRGRRRDGRGGEDVGHGGDGPPSVGGLRAG